MRTLAKVVLAIGVGQLLYAIVHEIGYGHGAKDVLKANNIDSFTYKTKHGSEIVYRAPK